MKNKLFWPIVLVTVVIIIESVLLLTGGVKNKAVVPNNDMSGSVEEEKMADAVSFEWENGEKAVLMMTANEEVSLDALDLYVGYKNATVDKMTSFDDLTKATFSKVSEDKSLLVVNYLVSEADGFKMVPGQSVKLIEVELSPVSTGSMELFIDDKTQVVENGSAKVLPFNSQNLIVNSTL
ncbi:hypothetical protein KKD37_00485 [Patescibacteria group bacterium]|nr:hypothetical protein [Patescibacteria group bacterium]